VVVTVVGPSEDMGLAGSVYLRTFKSFLALIYRGEGVEWTSG
jgi:hypothetical protein